MSDEGGGVEVRAVTSALLCRLPRWGTLPIVLDGGVVRSAGSGSIGWFRGETRSHSGGGGGGWQAFG